MSNLARTNWVRCPKTIGFLRVQASLCAVDDSYRKPMLTKMFLGCLLFFLSSIHASNAFSPSFAPTFDVIEECLPRTLISGVAEYLKQIMLVTVEMPNSTSYQLMGTDPFTKSFDINPKTGELRTVGRIDRESICVPDVTSRNDIGIDSSCLKSLNVLINSHGIDQAARSSIRKQIMLKIIDINDNTPNWPGKRILTVKFVEAFQSGPSFGKQEVTTQSQLLDRAVDPDAGPNGTISYSLKGTGADMFRLEYSDLENGRYDQQDSNSPLRLKPVVPLDRETFEYYNLTLYAFDAGNPRRSSSIQLEVYVTDFNDHAPVFHSYNSGHSAYSRDNKQGDSGRIILERTHLMETARIGSEVLRLNATDKDSGENARITYSIFPGDATLVQPYFDLDPISGILRVLAVDGAPEAIRLTGTASVEIELTDYNDEPPNIEVLIPQNGNLNNGNIANINGGINPILLPGSKHHEHVAFIEESPSPDIVIAYIQVCVEVMTTIAII
ncbi:unnamed protein product [Rodentolepis nana]|uniref:Cadherin domain-containing protein n=1 Tax=Rodentolepis nana TaxID=102285 RepID=A0A0R3TZ21_RODNA|nr:unnamed protein product [Rodentolepis nana]